jgi:uncharacterized protein YndB with AHSA1/START domain
MQVEVKVEIERPRAEVWEFLANSENLPRWSSDFAACSRHADDRDPPGAGARYDFTMNLPARSGTLEYVEFEPNRRLAWEADRIKANGGWARPKVAYTLDDEAGTTVVAIEVEAEFGGTIRLLSPLIRRSILRGRTADAARLKEVLEQRRP